jgi:hypothetical protein
MVASGSAPTCMLIVVPQIQLGSVAHSANFGCIPSLFPRVQQAADWAALFGGLFSAFWWIAIRSPALRHPQHGRSPEQ